MAGRWPGRHPRDHRVEHAGDEAPRAPAVHGAGRDAATAVFLPIACLPDFVVVPALGVTEPPWDWGAGEIAISAIHHVSYALGASAGLALTRRR